MSLQLCIYRSILTPASTNLAVKGLGTVDMAGSKLLSIILGFRGGIGMDYLHK